MPLWKRKNCRDGKQIVFVRGSGVGKKEELSW